ncbi:hypothetical protein IJH06_03205 [Candidatus Saccharibacteria bacterium]|nr:hypothetical protein [Candidatus Saccharibacteria bacterium]
MKKLTRRWLKRELYKAYLEARKHKRHTKDVYLFEQNLEANLDQLCEDLFMRRYKPSRGIAFIIKVPVMREIFAAPFRDRIVHHFLYNMSYYWWDRRLENDSYSCRKGRGTLFGIKRLQHFIKSVSRDYTQKAYVVKLDIQGYFMSLSRKKLYERVCWGLDMQFSEERSMRGFLKYIWGEVIFDDPCKGVFIRGSKKDWRRLPRSKSLFRQPPGFGIVIGNLSSQLLSNIYLDALDRYVVHELGYKAYGRYVDDFFIVVDEAHLAQLKEDVKKIERFLKEELCLTLHPNKRYLQEAHKGVEFLGTVIYPGHIGVTRRFKNNFYKAAAEVSMGYRDVASMASYLGLAKHYDVMKLAKDVFEWYGWDYYY